MGLKFFWEEEGPGERTPESPQIFVIQGMAETIFLGVSLVLSQLQGHISLSAVQALEFSHTS